MTRNRLVLLFTLAVAFFTQGANYSHAQTPAPTRPPLFCMDGRSRGGSIMVTADHCLCSGCRDKQSFITEDPTQCAANGCSSKRCATDKGTSRKKSTAEACAIGHAWVEEQVRNGTAAAPGGCAAGCVACEVGIYSEPHSGSTACVVEYKQPCVKDPAFCPPLPTPTPTPRPTNTPRATRTAQR
jgi:hypothetical protein